MVNVIYLGFHIQLKIYDIVKSRYVFKMALPIKSNFDIFKP